MTTQRVCYNKPRPLSAQHTDEEFSVGNRVAALYDFDSDRIKPGDLGFVDDVDVDGLDTFVLVTFDVGLQYWVEDWEITQAAE